VSEAAPTAGLSDSEASARLRRGEGNVSVTGTSRTYARILRTNVFSLYNTILFVIGGALLAMGRVNDAVISVGLGVLNAAISAVQEIRAKRQLDRLQLLARGTVVVVRDGRDIDVPRKGSCAATSCGCGPATRSWSTARCSTARSRWTSRC
jgi:cation-transporting ATPase E